MTFLLVDQNQKVKWRPTCILKFDVKWEMDVFEYKIFHLSLYLLSFDKAIIWKWFEVFCSCANLIRFVIEIMEIILWGTFYWTTHFQICNFCAYWVKRTCDQAHKGNSMAALWPRDQVYIQQMGRELWIRYRITFCPEKRKTKLLSWRSQWTLI